MKLLIAFVVTIGLMAGTAYAGSCGSGKSHDHAKEASAKSDNYTILKTAKKAGSFSTLLAAVEAAGLEETLNSDGPFTVFAPTDEAFAKLPEGTVAALLEDKEKLTAILTYHVVAGKVLAKDAVKLTEAQTVNGQSFTIDASNDGVMIDNANVITTDIMASNGVIHVIDSVIIPEETSKKAKY